MAFKGDSIYWVEVEKVVPNPFQPRKVFDDSKLQELADSIRMYGVLQPLTVTRAEIQKEDGTFFTQYELIAGERRLRASRLAGVAQVPVIIREGEQSQQEKLELAIIENLQREDLNSVDRALAFKQLADEFKMSHTEVAKKVQRSREYVSNSIRLLGLPDYIIESLRGGDLSEGHARTLLMLSDRPQEQEVIFREILLKKLSVREVERIVRKIATDKIRKKGPEDFDANLLDFEKQFTETLGTRVQIQKTDFGGKLTIDYFSEDDLSVILKRVKDDADNTKISQGQMTEKLTSSTPLVAVSDTPAPAAVSGAPTQVASHQAPAPDSYSQSVTQAYNTASQPQVVNPEPPAPAAVNDVPATYAQPQPTATAYNPQPQPQAVNPEPVNQPSEPQAEPQPSYQAQSHSENHFSAPAQTPTPTKNTFAVADHSRNEQVESVVSQPNPADEVPQPEEKKEDDSDLYSINSFNI